MAINPVHLGGKMPVNHLIYKTAFHPLAKNEETPVSYSVRIVLPQCRLSKHCSGHKTSTPQTKNTSTVGANQRSI
jgi:hypothetical protein